MRLLLFLSPFLLLSACGMADDERTEESKRTFVTIADPAFREYLLQTYDLNGDSRISHYEAERVLYIDCSGWGIASLYGIENFTSLRSLDCSDNGLVTLDLSRLAQLEELDCSGNDLSRVRIGELRRLWRIACADNRIDYLDLEYAGSLLELNCANNTLTTLDVSNGQSHMISVDATGNGPMTVFYKGRTQLIDRLLLDGGVQIVER